MYQLGWATGCPDISSNITLGVSMRTFPDAINIWISRQSKEDCPPQCGWAPIQSVEDMNRTKRPSKREFLLPDCLSWDTGLFCLLAQTKTLALFGSQACWLLNWNLHHLLSWFSGLQTRTGTTLWLSRVSSCLTADLGTSQPPKSCEAIPYFIYVYSHAPHDDI